MWVETFGKLGSDFVSCGKEKWQTRDSPRIGDTVNGFATLILKNEYRNEFLQAVSKAPQP